MHTCNNTLWTIIICFKYILTHMYYFGTQEYIVIKKTIYINYNNAYL